MKETFDIILPFDFGNENSRLNSSASFYLYFCNTYLTVLPISNTLYIAKKYILHYIFMNDTADNLYTLQ